LVVEGPDRPRVDLDLDTAARAAGGSPLTGKNPVRLDLELEQLGRLGLECIRLHPCPHGVGALQLGLAARPDDDEIGMSPLRRGVEVAAVERLVAALDALDQLLVGERHGRQYRGGPWKQGR
jgi:hypothetical protein